MEFVSQGFAEVDEDSLNCQHEETGCLFQLDVDPCEYRNVGAEYPDVVSEMSARLDAWERAVDPLVTLDDRIEACDDTFWSPFEGYVEGAVSREIWCGERGGEVVVDGCGSGV